MKSQTDDGRQHWVLVMLIFTLASVIETVGFGQLSAFTPLYLAQLHTPAVEIPRWTGILAAEAFVIGIPLAPFWGVWADKYSRKLIIARSAYIQALVFLGVGLSRNVWQLAGVSVGTGFVLGNTGVMFAALSAATPRYRMGLAISTVAMGGPLGIALGPIAGGLMAGRIGYSRIFLIDAGLYTISALLITFGYREDRTRIRSTEGVMLMLKRSLRDVTRVRWVASLFGAYFVFLLGSRLLRPFLPLYVSQLYGSVGHLGLPTVVGLVVGASSLALAVAGPFWGRLGDRRGFARMMVLGTAGTATGLLLQAASRNVGQLLVASILTGVLAGGFQGLFTASLALGVPDQRRTSVLNLTYLPFYFAGVLAPLVATVLYGLGLRVLFVVSAGLTVVALALVRDSSRNAARSLSSDSST
ncbi:MAG: MFS transporter [Candidatus Dormibacteria bacterium]